MSLSYAFSLDMCRSFLSNGCHIMLKNPKLSTGHYGNTGNGVFKRGVQNEKDFCLKINILKGNY